MRIAYGLGSSQTDPKTRRSGKKVNFGGFEPPPPLRDSLWLRAACAGSRGDRIFPAENSGKRARNGHFGLPSQDLVHCGCRKRYHIFLSNRGPAGVGRGRVPSDNRDDSDEHEAKPVRTAILRAADERWTKKGFSPWRGGGSNSWEPGQAPPTEA